MCRVFSNRSLVSLLLALVLLASPLQLSAESGAETTAGGVADILGEMLKQTGNPVAGGSLRSLEHLFSNWDNVTNPCRNSIRLLSAFIQDAKEGSGLNFADVMINTFDLPQFGSWTAAQLVDQGEIISTQLRSGNRAANIGKIRQAMREIRLLCNPPPPPQAATATPTPAVAAGAAPVTPPPVTQPPPEPKPVAKPEPKKPATPPPPPEPDWSVDNPCPACKLEAEMVEYFLERIADKKKRLAEVRQQLADNRAKQAGLQRDIAQLERRLNRESGVGASSTDADGNTTSAYDQGDGTVKVQTTDAQGRVVESHSYKRRSSADFLRDKTAKEAELAGLKKDEAGLTKTETLVAGLVAEAETDLVAARSDLADCVVYKCRKGKTLTADEPQQVACDYSAAGQPIAIGPVSDYKGVGKTVGKAARGMASKALGGLLGGSIGIGGGGGDSPSGPKISKDPIKDKHKQRFAHRESGTKLEIGGRMTDEGLRITSDIDKAPDKNTFHTAFTVNSDCQKQFPKKYYVYELWRDWSVGVWWTSDHYVNDQLVEHNEGESFAAGSDLLDTGVFDAASMADAVNAAGPIWKRQGFGAPTSGVKRLGSVFDASAEALTQGTVVAYHVTRQNGDVYETVGFPLNVRLDEASGKLTFSPVEGSGIRVD